MTGNQQAVGVDHVRSAGHQGAEVLALDDLELVDLGWLDNLNLVHLVGQGLTQIVDVEDVPLFHPGQVSEKEAGIPTCFTMFSLF